MTKTSSSSMTTSAPGKLVLAGEYAVAFGGRAVVTAIDRRAVARFDAAARAAAGPLPLLDAVAEVLGGLDADAAARARDLVVDTTAFRATATEGARKLGLGSSAAAVVAATGLALPGATPAQVHELARAAHARAQATRGAAGSGVDIAAAVWGGTSSFQAGACTPITLPAAARWRAYDLGQPADTPSLLAAVTAARTAAPTVLEPLLEGLHDAALRLIRATIAPEAIAAIDAGALALDALAAAIGVDLATPAGHAVQALARRLGGAAKTCGAGAGDVGIAVLPDDDAVTAFGAGLAACGAAALDLRLGQPGFVVHRAA
jgi:phosphomevalonate kinase